MKCTKYNKNDIIYADNMWWIVEIQITDSVLGCKHVDTSFADYVNIDEIEHHIKPTVKDPCDVRPGPATL